MTEHTQKNRKLTSTLGRWVAFILVLIMIGSIGLLTLRKNVSSDTPAEIKDYQPWKSQVVEGVRDIAVQDGGRMKPFSTWAAFSMLELHGSRSMTITVKGEKEKLGPEEVMLDCLFRPVLARKLPIFRIDNSEVITGLTYDSLSSEVRERSGADKEEFENAIKELQKKGRRDRYSYDELHDIAPVLLAKGQFLRDENPDKSKMTADTKRTVDLAQKVWRFMQLTYYMDFARADVPIKEDSPVGNKEQMKRMSYWIRAFPALAEAVRRTTPDGQRLPGHLLELFGDLETKMSRASSENIRLVPAYDDSGDWLPMGKRIEQVVSGDRTYADGLAEDIELLENAFVDLREKDQIAFSESLQVWKKSVHERLDAEVVAKLNTEVIHNRVNYFYYALIAFIIGFVVVMFGWLAPRTIGARICNWIAAAICIIALKLMIAGIVHRCIIMERSPIGNLYDTIIFIGTVAVLVLLLVELMTRRAVALGLSVFMGMACMFLARRYEIGDASDHMDPLVAVLKSNYWLSTHVVTITIGYMGGLVAAGLSVVYIFARILGIDEGDKKFRRAMTRIAYGMVCFTLFFSLIGTVLGGIWANDSWGRFWGWDPKENGALMIVLWCLVVLHARLAGYLKEWGLHIAGVFGANIVAFSWWHVNSLGTGLHSYGFIEGVGFVRVFYTVMTGVCVIGGIAAIVTKVMQKAAKTLPDEESSPMATKQEV